MGSRKYYERNNHLISQYLFIDRLLDSSVPHNLISEYDRSGENGVDIPQTITEELPPGEEPARNGCNIKAKVKRTPRALYHVPTTDENTPLLDDGAAEGPKTSDIEAGQDEGIDSNDPIVTLAIYINLAANTILLVGKIAVMVLTDSLSVLASLVDAALDFLSTAIVWITSTLIARQDRYAYPVGRRRLEPIGVLVFSVIMITSFFQVFLECFNRLISSDRSVVELGIPAVVIMASTVLIKFCCWLWCRFIKNSSVQALAQDAMTDVIFNTFSIIFPLSKSLSLSPSCSLRLCTLLPPPSAVRALPCTFKKRNLTLPLHAVGHYAQIWYLDPLGGLLLSLFVILNWAFTSASHIRNLTGRAATADERNVLLYLTMRFARTIKSIQGLQAYHAGDKLNVEVDIVLDESMQLRDSHDLGESLQYMLESVPVVDRAFVHMDYRAENLPTHMEQQE